MGTSNRDKDKFEILKKAILSKQVIRFDYLSSYGERTTRDVMPLKLLFKSKFWYLKAYCSLRNEYRSFKVNRIINLHILEEDFINFDLDLLEDKSIENNIDIRPIKLKFKRIVAYRLLDEFQIEDLVADKEGHYVVEENFPVDSWLYSFLLSFANEVEVIEPKEVREGLIEEINKMKEVYK